MTSLTAPAVPAHDPSVDVLRGIAILMVLVLHAVAMTPGIEAHAWITTVAHRLGSGVQLFFLLSGFVIAGAFERGQARGEGVSGFLWRRCAKMLPLYLLFLHANIAFYLLAGALAEPPAFFRNSVSAENLTWSNYVVHLLLLQGLFPAWLHSLLDGSWSIACEVYFYIAYPLVIQRFTRAPAQALIAFIGSLVFAVAFTMLLGRHLGSYGYYAFPLQLPCFLLGIYCFRVRRAWPNLETVGTHKTALALVMACLFFGLAKAETAPLGAHMLHAVLFALTLLLVPMRSRSLLAEATRSFGRQSYALFLVHLFLLKLVYTLFVARYPQWSTPSVLALNLGVSIGLSWLLSWALFNRIDEWFVRHGSQWLQRRSLTKLSVKAG